MNTKHNISRFEAFNISIDVIRRLGEVVAAIAARDAGLATQLKKAASSVSLNLSEGRRRAGRDRLHHWRIAAGSADETRACLLVAEAWGYVTRDEHLDAILDRLDSLLAILWTLTNKPTRQRG